MEPNECTHPSLIWAWKSRNEYARASIYASRMSVVSHGIRQPIGEIATDCETSWTKCNYERDITPPFSPPPPSVSRTNASDVCFDVCNRPEIRGAACRYTSSWECSRTAFICYATNNPVDLERNVGTEATNLSVNFEAQFSMHGNWYANLLRSRL